MAKKDLSEAARLLGHKGGLKGGRARWHGVSAAERRKVARQAALARWAKKESK